jgi:hypothetical protein
MAGRWVVECAPFGSDSRLHTVTCLVLLNCSRGKMLQPHPFCSNQIKKLMLRITAESDILRLRFPMWFIQTETAIDQNILKLKLGCCDTRVYTEFVLALRAIASQSRTIIIDPARSPLR